MMILVLDHGLLGLMCHTLMHGSFAATTGHQVPLDFHIHLHIHKDTNTHYALDSLIFKGRKTWSMPCRMKAKN